jgi:DNA repair protein RadA/Sms
MGFCSACGSREPLVQAPSQPSAGSSWLGFTDGAPQELSEVSLEDVPRILLPMPELNRVLGGGVVPGSVVLMAGDPGIGKSTLLLQVAEAMCAARDGPPRGEGAVRVLYISGEESAPQIRMRAERLGILGSGVFLLGETSLQGMLGWMDKLSPGAVIVDSIQTVASDAVSSAPGSVAQVRECARVLMGWAKAHRTPLFMAGHVTKEGDLAGPRVLEHMVDVVLSLEGEPLSSLRVLRSTKNRFGSTNEVAIFQMEQGGLKEVADPSQALMSRRQGSLVGSALVSTLEGSRPLLVEIQALTVPTHNPAPRRVVSGLDGTRLVMLAAVLDRRVGLPLGGQDIIVNVAGGLRVGEPAADLGIALAVASSLRGVPLPEELVVLGEVGLAGEVRSVSQVERRLQEAARLGLTRAVAPQGAIGGEDQGREIQVHQVATLAEALDVALPGARRRRRSTAGPEAAQERA